MENSVIAVQKQPWKPRPLMASLPSLWWKTEGLFAGVSQTGSLSWMTPDHLGTEVPLENQGDKCSCTRGTGAVSAFFPPLCSQAVAA